MRRKKCIFSRKALILLLIAAFVLSGCGQGDSLSTETADNHISEETDTSLTETGDTVKTEDTTTEDQKNEPFEVLPKPSEVPVNTKAEEIHYYCEGSIDILNARYHCISDGENIYLVYYKPDLYVMPIGTDEHSRVDIDNPEGLYACQIALDTYGRIHLLMTDSENDEWFIWRLDEDYQIDKVIDISAYFGTNRAPCWFLIDKDGTYYFQWPINWSGIILDSEGVLKHRFTTKSLGIRGSYEAAVGKDGQIYIVYLNGEKKLEIGAFDMENCSINMEDSPFSFPSDSETFSAMSAGTDTNLLLFSPFSGVWACDTENGVMENRMPISDIGSGGGMDLCPLTFLPDGRFLLGESVNDSQADGVKHRLLRYIPVGRELK